MFFVVDVQPQFLKICRHIIVPVLSLSFPERVASVRQHYLVVDSCDSSLVLISASLSGVDLERI